MANDFQISELGQGLILVNVVDYKTGLTKINEVHAVRIHDQKLYSLIMNDYAPTMGRIDGDIMFVKNDGEIAYNNIIGFYKHHHNEFTLVIEKYKE